MPSRRPLGVRFTGSTFEIVPGVLYACGLPVRLGKPGDAAFTYATQPDFPSAPGAVAAGDLIYVDAWEREVSFLEDPALQDPGLNGADTCTRTQTMLQIKRAPTGLSPELTIEFDARNPEVGNALLGIGLRRTKSSTDILDPAADEVAIDQPIGNFLFRVEIHDVQGPANNPTSITLKWSSENAAEAYASGAAPPDYKGSDWVYEFHGPTSEKQLGVHLVSFPARRALDAGYPATEPDKTQLPWVRRWDGFCVLTRANASTDWTTANIAGGKDRGVALSSGIADGVHGHAEIIAVPPTGTPTSLILRLNLQLVDLQLHLKAKSFVAGDYWLAVARDQFVSGQQLLELQAPGGRRAPLPPARQGREFGRRAGVPARSTDDLPVAGRPRARLARRLRLPADRRRGHHRQPQRVGQRHRQLAARGAAQSVEHIEPAQRPALPAPRRLGHRAARHRDAQGGVHLGQSARRRGVHVFGLRGRRRHGESVTAVRQWPEDRADRGADRQGQSKRLRRRHHRYLLAPRVRHQQDVTVGQGAGQSRHLHDRRAGDAREGRHHGGQGHQQREVRPGERQGGEGSQGEQGHPRQDQQGQQGEQGEH